MSCQWALDNQAANMWRRLQPVLRLGPAPAVTISPHAGPVIRPATIADAAALRCLIGELQTYERRPTRRPSAEIADAYLDWL